MIPIETSHLFCRQKQMTVFYRFNTGMNSVKRLSVELEKLILHVRVQTISLWVTYSP